jgi:hypothetical protein
MYKRISRLLGTSLIAVGLPLGAMATTANAATVPPSATAVSHKAAAATSAAAALGVSHVRPLTSTEIQALGLSAQVTNASVRCWTDNFTMSPLVGMSEGGSEDWCGNGTLITYAQAGNCYGSTSLPTWNFLGCSVTGYYGAGWNQAQQQVNWNMCTLWIPWPSATCVHNQVNYVRLGFGPAGNVWTVSKGVL